MLFSHIVFVALSVFGLVQAIPSPLAKEGVVERATNADVTGVLNTLKGRTDTILPQINALVASGNVNDRNVKPLFDQLSSALKTADGSLGKFKAQGLVSRQNQDEVAAVSADIIKNINATLTSFPFDISLISAIGLLLFNLIISLNFLVPGLIAVVVGLLNAVSGVLLTVILALISILV